MLNLLISNQHNDVERDVLFTFRKFWNKNWIKFKVHRLSACGLHKAFYQFSFELNVGASKPIEQIFRRKSIQLSLFAKYCPSRSSWKWRLKDSNQGKASLDRSLWVMGWKIKSSQGLAHRTHSSTTHRRWGCLLAPLQGTIARGRQKHNTAQPSTAP